MAANIDGTTGVQHDKELLICGSVYLTENQIAELALIGSRNLYLDEMEEGRISYGGIMEILKRYEELRKTDYKRNLLSKVSEATDSLHKRSVSCSVRLEDSIVIVVDNGNYNASYAEQVPFKARVKEKRYNEVLVVSLVTGKEYELYYSQILESLEIDEIIRLLDLSKYSA